jgi:SAM-dependent methyltransferase
MTGTPNGTTAGTSRRPSATHRMCWSCSARRWPVPGRRLRQRALLRRSHYHRADRGRVRPVGRPVAHRSGPVPPDRAGDAATLPFADGTFPTVATMWISTDVDDFVAVLAEAARVLTPGGLLVFYGAHPCFNGPHTQWLDDSGILAHPTYRLAGWHQEAPWWGAYVRRRVGMRHHPLADLLNAFISTELVIEHVAELGDRPVPVILAIRARKSPVTAMTTSQGAPSPSHRSFDRHGAGLPRSSA